jgi:hypothetical protein
MQPYQGTPPNCTSPGSIFTALGDGTPRGRWSPPAGVVAFSITKTYVVFNPSAGALGVFHMTVPAGVTVSLVSIIAVTSAGTCTVEAFHNGSAIAGLTSVSVSTTSTGRVPPTTNPTSVGDLDTFSATISSPSGMSTAFVTIDFEFVITP